MNRHAVKRWASARGVHLPDELVPPTGTSLLLVRPQSVCPLRQFLLKRVDHLGRHAGLHFSEAASSELEQSFDLC